MRLPCRRHFVPLWAIFCTVTLLVLRSCRNQHLTCHEFVEKKEEANEDHSRSATRNTSISTYVNSTIPFHPFEKGEPKLVVILTYQRCGSTFFGQLFNENPNAFYMFEPLDSLYTAMYGTKQGWNVPSDITNYKNGSQRTLPQQEIASVSEFLLNLLTCDVDALPTETLIHEYFREMPTEFLGMTKFLRCIRRLKPRPSRCTSLAPVDYCGERFGEKSDDVLADCYRSMTAVNNRRIHKDSPIFYEYFKCMSHSRELLDEKYSQSWLKSCSSQPLRAVKLVRGTMDSMEPLLRALPNLSVFHLIRDPRAVVLSRKNFGFSARGMFTELDPNQTLTREALLYCRTVVRDVRRRKELEAIYPGKILTIIYDDVVRDLKGYIRKVYEFLGLMLVPQDVWSWYKASNYSRHYGNRSDPMEIANKWLNVITIRENNEIKAACKEFFKVVNYTFAN